MIKGWSTITQDAFKASKELEDINSKALDKVTENQINSNALGGEHQIFENLSENKKYPDLLANHNELLTTYSEVFSKATTNAGDLIATVKNDYEDWTKKESKNLQAMSCLIILSLLKETTRRMDIKRIRNNK